MSIPAGGLSRGPRMFVNTALPDRTACPVRPSSTSSSRFPGAPATTATRPIATRSNGTCGVSRWPAGPTRSDPPCSARTPVTSNRNCLRGPFPRTDRPPTASMEASVTAQSSNDRTSVTFRSARFLIVTSSPCCCGPCGFGGSGAPHCARPPSGTGWIVAMSGSPNPSSISCHFPSAIRPSSNTRRHGRRCTVTFVRTVPAWKMSWP